MEGDQCSLAKGNDKHKLAVDVVFYFCSEKEQQIMGY